MPVRTYIGPIDIIATVLLDGREVVVARGEPVTVSDEDAVRLDAQPDNWAKPQTKAAREAHATTEES